MTHPSSSEMEADSDSDVSLIPAYTGHTPDPRNSLLLGRQHHND